MSDEKLLDRLIEILCGERGNKSPDVSAERKPELFRALCNVRPPSPVTDEFLRLQDEYLSACTMERGIVDVGGLGYADGIALWQGDITRLNADAIVNAGNSVLLGCFAPLHECIDNAIHSSAGVQVRLDCDRLMKGGRESNGNVKVTPAYNLPSRYIFHTVGPIVTGGVKRQNRLDLKRCYLSCLEKAEEMELSSLAFCCLSTGVFRFPKPEACDIAVSTVRDWFNNNASGLKVVFNVFSGEDYEIYKSRLSDV